MSINKETTEDMIPSITTPQQIERLKRQEEDEQWISGEELCTEGSSEDDDEEAISSAIKTPKAVHRQRKHKKLNHLLATKRIPRRPSPLAQEIHNTSFISSSSQTTKQSTSDDQECSDDETASQMIVDINTSYVEMLNRIKKLRQVMNEEKAPSQKPTNEEIKIIKESDTNIEKIFNDIRLLDEQIAKTEKQRAEEYKTRLQKQQELCNQIVIPEKYHPLAKNSESFLRLCQSDTLAFKKMQDKMDSSDKKTKRKEKPENKNKPEPTPKTEAYFVSRNIKIAGERGINALPLSDEQKQRLFFLLKDIDENEDEENFNFPSDTDFLNNVFKSRNENQQLREINQKLDIYKKLVSSVHRSEHLKAITSEKSNVKLHECFKLKHIKNELSCIDRNLKTYKNKCRKQEFEPLPKEQMSNLIQSCASSLSLRSEPLSMNEDPYVFYDLPHEMIPNDQERKKLISQAKASLPRFKFRFPAGDNENFNEEKNNQLKDYIEENITMSN